MRSACCAASNSALLQELGYGIDLATEAESGQPVMADGRYVFIIERG